MKNSLKIIHWTPRILCILAILFVSMFALDAFDPKLTLLQQVQAFLMHLIPSFVLLILLVVAWNWELAGGIVILASAIAVTPTIFSGNYRMNHSVLMSLSVILVITFPFMLAGGLFILSHFLKKKNLSEPT
jgi:hypothetical protein